MSAQTLAVLGDGAFGTACAQVLANNGYKVILWCNNPAVAMSIQKSRRNPRYLPGIELPETIIATTDLAEALTASLIFQAIPVKFLRSVLTNACSYAREDHLWVSLSKGIEQETLLFPAEIIQDVLGQQTNVAVLSGPSYARDLALKQPTGVEVATYNKAVFDSIHALFSNKYVQVVQSSDVIGIQIAGALKNITALAIGLLEGAGYGPNSQALVFMQALSEIKTIIQALGGREESLYGLAGIGDLTLTTFGKESRNYKLGLLLGRGTPLDAAVQELGTSPEGYNTLQAVHALSKKYTLSLPVFEKTYAIVFEKQPVSAYFS